MSVQPQQQDLFKNGHQRWAPYAADQNFSQNQSINGAMSFANSQQTKQNNQIIAAFQNPPPTASAPHIHHTQQTVTQQQLQQQQQQQQQAVAVVSVPTQLQQVSQSSSQAPHTALIMGQVNQPPQNALPLGQFDKNSQNKFYSGTFQPLQRNGQFNYPVQLIAPQAGSQAQQVQPPYPNSAAQSLSSSQHQILSQQQSTQNPSQQQNLAGVNSQNSASSTGSSTSQTLNNSQNQGQQGQQAQGTSNNTSSLQQHNKNMLSVNGNLLGTTSASTNTSNQIGNSSNNINSNTNGSTNSTNCNQNSSNSNQTNGQSNMNGSHHNSSTNGGLSKGNTSSSTNNNNNNNNNSNSNNNNRESSSSNGQIYHRMGDVNLCKQNLCCMVCEKNICDDCQDHMKDHYALNIDKLFEQSFANQISSSQKSYQSCLDSLEKNEKTFIKFQEAIHELIDNAYHNYKIAEAYNNKDYKLFGQIFRKHYQMTQAQDNTQILSYQEKPESSVNQKDVIGKQFEKNYEKLYNFILIMNQITTDEITQHLGSQSTQSVPIYNVIGSSNIVSNQNTLNQQSNQAMSVQAAVQQSGGPLQMNAMNENNPQKIHIPPPPFPQHQAQGHLQNYQYIGTQIYDPHLSFPQGGNHPQGFYIHNPHVRYPPGMPMHNQHLKVNPNPANNYLIHQMPQNGGLNKPNSYQKQDFNSCIDQGPTKKIQTNPKQKPNISNSQSSVYNSTQNSMLSQNNYSSHSKQGQQYLNNSSTGQPQSQLSSEDSLPTQNEGQMINNQVGEPMIIENQNKLLSSDIIHTKQEAIELNSKTSSHSNLPVIQNLSQQGLNTQSKQSAQQQLDNSQRLQNASPQYSNNFSNPINNNSNGKIIVSLSAQNVPPEENSEHQQHKSKPQKKHKSDETKLIAYIEYTQNQSIKDLAKKYSVVEGTIKKWISDISNGKITFTQSQLNQQGLNSLPPLPTQPSTAVTSMTSVSPILAAVPPTTSSNNQIINQKIENLNSYDNEANQNSNSQSQQENEMDQNEEQSDERDQYDQKLQEQQHLESKLQKQPMMQKIENLDGIENDLAQNSQSESSSNKKDQIEKQNEMKLICFRMLKNSNFPEIPLETTIFALSKDGTLQIKYMPGGDQQDKLIYQENFNKRIKELKFQIIKQESIIFIHLEDDSLYMWRWQLKENYQLLQKRVQNFDAFVYFGNLFVIVQKGDMHIQVYTMDNKLISNISNIRPKEDCFGENYIINNLVGWGSEENKQWYICCNSGNYFWAYSLEINEQSLQTFFENQTPLNDFKIIYEAFTEDCQEIFKMRLHKNQLTSQEVIGASDSGLLYIFDILKGRQSYFKMKSQGEKQMLDIQVFHPYNQNHENFQEQIEQDEPKIILCYDSFIRIRKYKKLQFPQGMRCATLEVKTQEIIIYYVQNSQDQILKHTLNS
ncbi:hypothetical protein ABPG72_011032 [Tetrahymena utriculariae]